MEIPVGSWYLLPTIKVVNKNMTDTSLYMIMSMLSRLVMLHSPAAAAELLTGLAADYLLYYSVLHLTLMLGRVCQVSPQ